MKHLEAPQDVISNMRNKLPNTFYGIDKKDIKCIMKQKSDTTDKYYTHNNVVNLCIRYINPIKI